MNKKMTLAYTLAGVVVATSVIGVTASTTGLGTPADSTVQTTSSTATLPGAAGTVDSSIVPAAAPAAPALAQGERVTGTEVLQTAAGPVEYVYVDAPARRYDDEDEDDHEREHDEHEDHEEREHREGGSEAVRQLLALVGRRER